MLTIKQTHEATGVTPSRLRIWEGRYGWPNPHRSKGGQRMYPESLIADIKSMQARRLKGIPISDLIRDGKPVPEDAPLPRRKAPPVSYADLPQPESRQGQIVFRTVLKQAEETPNCPSVIQHLLNHYLPTLAPWERGNVVDILRRMEGKI